MTQFLQRCEFNDIFRLKIFKLQAQIFCNTMQMTNEEVQEYQVEFCLICLQK